MNGKQSAAIIRTPDIHSIDAPDFALLPLTHRILTVAEAARELRCSKAHVHHIITGKVANVPPLPVLRIGRRVIIRGSALRAWMEALEARDIKAQKLTGLLR